MTRGSMRWFWVALLPLAGCSSKGEDSCVPGKTVECACLGGSAGVQTCTADRTYGECLCDERPGDGGQPADSSKEPPSRLEAGGGPGAPVFLSFGTSATSLTEGESVTITAVLTDPDGIDDLIGGSLLDEQGDIQYGAFATSGQEGAYSLTLTWDGINQAKKLDFVKEERRTFVAQFFDQEQHVVRKPATLRLHCDGSWPLAGACDGHCRDLTTTTNCGSCGNSCGQGQSCVQGTCGCPAGKMLCGGKCVDVTTDPQNCGGCGTSCDLCDQGVCNVWSGCVSPSTSTTTTCADVCASQGMKCGTAAGCSPAPPRHLKTYGTAAECAAKGMGFALGDDSCSAGVTPTLNSRCCCAP